MTLPILTRLEHIKQSIVDHLHPERIVLFGSRTRGDCREDSDFDLMVEMKTDLAPHDRILAVHRLFGLRDWSMDVFVYTPEEVSQLQKVNGSLVALIMDEGQTIYDRRTQ